MNQNHTIGFGLVEIAVSMGIASFAIIALLGLISVGMDANKSSKEETDLAMIAAIIMADLQADAATGIGNLQSRTFSFDYSSNPSTGSDTYYTCAADVLPVNPSQQGASVSRHVVLRFSWPKQSSTPNERTLSSTITER